MRDLSLHLMDIVQNSVKAGARRIDINIYTDGSDSILSIEIVDDGCGMDADMLIKVRDPFVTSRTTRKVGMGIPMFEESAKAADGYLELESQVGRGTRIKANFSVNHIDRLPLGDIGTTISTLVMSEPLIHWVVKLHSSQGEDDFDTDIVKAQIGDIPIENVNIIEWIRDYINHSIQNIFGGVLNEIVS